MFYFSKCLFRSEKLIFYEFEFKIKLIFWDKVWLGFFVMSFEISLSIFSNPRGFIFFFFKSVIKQKTKTLEIVINDRKPTKRKWKKKRKHSIKKWSLSFLRILIIWSIIILVFLLWLEGIFSFAWTTQLSVIMCLCLHSIHDVTHKLNNNIWIRLSYHEVAIVIFCRVFSFSNWFCCVIQLILMMFISIFFQFRSL